MSEIEALLRWINERYGLDLSNQNFHIAIMEEPYLSRILEGRKVIETRFTQKKVRPYESVRKGDYVILKKSGGPFVALFHVSKVHYYEIQSRKDLMNIRDKYRDLICVDDDFWSTKEKSKYATLIYIENLLKFETPYSWTKKNRQAWLVYKNKEILRKPYIICLCGEIASGKTYLGNMLSETLKCERYSVSEYLRHYALNKSIEIRNRADLQKVGEQRILAGWEGFCKDFLNFACWENNMSLVIDGIRHIDFINMCKKICYPEQVFIVYLDISLEIREKRIIERGEPYFEQNHMAEGNLHEIKKEADLIITEEMCNGNGLIKTIESNLFR